MERKFNDETRSLGHPHVAGMPSGNLPRDGEAESCTARFREVPDGADVAASNRLAPQLTARATVWLYPQALDRDQQRPAWIVLTGNDSADVPRLRWLGYELLTERQGTVLLRRLIRR